LRHLGPCEKERLEGDANKGRPIEGREGNRDRYFRRSRQRDLKKRYGKRAIHVERVHGI